MRSLGWFLLFADAFEDKLTCFARLNSKQFGKPIASFQLIQKKLADASMEATRASLRSLVEAIS